MSIQPTIHESSEHLGSETKLNQKPRSKSTARWLSDVRRLLRNEPQIGTPTVFFDLDRLDDQVRTWNEAMPDVLPHFAVKACDVRSVLEHLQARGVAFDAATGGELKRLRQMNVPGEHVVMTHPIRDDSDLEQIRTHRPRAIVVQSSEEVIKLAEAGIPSGEYRPLLLVRIALPYSNLNKFGVQCIVPMHRPDGSGTTTAFDYRPLKAIYQTALRLEESIGVKYAGFGFAGHVGTNTTSPSHYQHLLGTFRVLGQELRRRAGISIRFFDLGGGYCDGMHAERVGVSQRELLASIHTACCKFRQEYGDDVTLIAEPGRYMVADTAVVVTRAKGVSEAFFRAVDGVETFERHKVIHIDDGLYGNLMGQVQDGRRYELIPFRLDSEDEIGGEGLASVIWGPTCDSFDRIIPPDDYRVPSDFATGDFMMVECMGAYSTVTATEFNRTKPTTIVTYSKAADGRLTYWLYGTNGAMLRSGTIEGGR